MKRFKQITGERFGRLFVKEWHKTDNLRRATFLCECDCGAEIIVTGCSLRSGHTLSCGCLQRDIAKTTMKAVNSTGMRNNLAHLIHGDRRTRLYSTWIQMKKRCTNKKYDHYDQYGGRGICICHEWVNNYVAFKDWAINNGYVNGLEIERINVNGNYEPANCTWATRTQQIRNRRNTIFIEHNGQKKPLAEWCEIHSTNYKLAHARYKRGLAFNDIFK